MHPHTTGEQPYNVCLFDLAPSEVCRAANVAISAVVSYTTVSSLPDPLLREAIGGLFSVALSVNKNELTCNSFLLPGR